MRMLASIAGIALLSSFIVACTDDDGRSTSINRLDKAGLQQALLSSENLGPGFEVTDEGDEGDNAPGCLVAIDEMGDEELRAEVAYQLENRADFNQRLVAYEDAEELERALKSLATDLDNCYTIQDTMGQADFDLTLRSNTSVSADVDQQVNATATGTLTVQGQSYPMSLSIRAAGVDNYAVIVFFVTFGRPDDVTGELLDAAVERLEAVREGQDPPDAEPLLVDYVRARADPF